MPYEIRKIDKGFKVCKKRSKRCYSNDPLPKRRAERQLRALYASEADMEGGGFFQNLLKRAFVGVSDMIVRPSGFNPSQIKYGWLRRPIDMPPLEDLAKMVASTYKADDDPEIQGYTQIAKSPTLAIFRVNKKKNIFIIALRGTAFTDINDISADLGIIRTIVQDANTARNVRNSSRYIDDVADIKEFQDIVKKYMRVKDPIYYGVGHSLSGAMMDELLEDGLISSAVSFNPAIERRMFAVPNDNHRIYIECDVIYNLLGKFITNGNLEVIPKANPRGDDAGAIDTTKGSIECHNINTVIPLMSGKGIENNVGLMYKTPMNFSRFLNKDEPSYPECERILQQPITQDVGANSGRERQRRAYEACVKNKGVIPKPPPPPKLDYAVKPVDTSRPSTTFQDLINQRSRPDFRPIGSGLFDTIVGNLGKSLADQASQGNILGRIKNTIDEGARKRKEEQDKAWGNSWFGSVGIPNPSKLFGGAEGEEDVEEPTKSYPIFDYTDRGAVEDRFYGEKADVPSKYGRQNMRLFGRGRRAKGGARPRVAGMMPIAGVMAAKGGEVFEPEIEAHAATVAVPDYSAFDDDKNPFGFDEARALNSIKQQKQRLAYQIRGDQYLDSEYDDFALYHYQQLRLLRHLLEKYQNNPIKVADIVARWSARARDDRYLDKDGSPYNM